MYIGSSFPEGKKKDLLLHLPPWFQGNYEFVCYGFWKSDFDIEQLREFLKN
jgi:hypothetical protein